MKNLVPLIFVFLAIGFWLAVDQKPDVGRLPEDDVIETFQQTNKVTGELLNIEIIRCRICHEVICYSKRTLRGKLLYQDNWQHHCWKYPKKLVKGTRSALFSPITGIMEWLEYWQRRLRLRK